MVVGPTDGRSTVTEGYCGMRAAEREREEELSLRVMVEVDSGWKRADTMLPTTFRLLL